MYFFLTPDGKPIINYTFFNIIWLARLAIGSIKLASLKYNHFLIYLAKRTFLLLQMSAETGGSIENIMESISTSMESLTSIIPVEKRQELSKFEMTLKGNFNLGLFVEE